MITLINRITNKFIIYCWLLLGYDPITKLKITQVKGMVLRRFGSRYGGWAIPLEILDENSICYCAGCGTDISFDLALIDKYNCSVFAFDPTPRSVAFVHSTAKNIPNYHFYEIGIWDKKDNLKFFVPSNPNHVSHSLANLQKTTDYITVPVDRLSNLMKSLNHEKIDMLKLDIEGAEYNVVDSLIEDMINVKILCIEYDEYFHPKDILFKERIKSSIQSLLDYGFTLISTEGNGNYTMVNFKYM